MRSLVANSAARLAAVLVLGLAVGAGVGFLLGRDEAKAPPPAPPADPTVPVEGPAPFRAGLPFSEPAVVERGADGVLRATLVAETGAGEVSGIDVDGLQSYAAEGLDAPRGLLGPTLHALPGDWIEITLDNRLTVPEDAEPEASVCVDGGRKPVKHAHDPAQVGDQAGRPQVTNLHFHGLHVTPRDRSPFGDTVVVDMHEGKSQFRFQIPPTHDQGTYWYHAHRHGCTDDQVFRGLAGLLLIGDSLTNLPPPFRDVRTRSLALKDVQVEQPKDESGWRIASDHDSQNPTHRTVNGLVNPTLDIRPGETQLWRLANVSSLVWYEVALLDRDRGGRRDTFTAVAQDGAPLERPVPMTSVVIPPGRRFDVLVRGPRSGGRVLKTLRFDQGHQVFPEDTLATVEVAGAPMPELAPPTSLPVRPSQEFPQRLGPKRRFTFDFDLRVASGFAATIDDGVFDPDIADAPPVLRTTERWVIYNKTGEWHPFHIHQNDFRVVKTSSDAIPNLPGVQDVVALPPGSPDEPSVVEIEMPFTDYHGKFVFHCHILDHEDAGMMSLVHVRKHATRRSR